MTFEELLSSLGFNPKQVLFILMNMKFDNSRMQYVVTKDGKEVFTLNKEFVDKYVTETYDDKGNRIPIKRGKRGIRNADCN